MTIYFYRNIIKANPRKDWKPTASSKICSIFFNEVDFESSCVDTNQHQRRKKLKLESGQLFQRRLKKGAVPSIFPGAPKYCSTCRVPSRSTVCATVSIRHEYEIKRNVEMEKNFFKSDCLANQTPNVSAER